MHTGEHQILERLAGDVIEGRQDEKVNRRNRLASYKTLQDKHHPGSLKAAPIERPARKPKRRLDVVERDQVSRRRSIGRGLADEFGHAITHGQHLYQNRYGAFFLHIYQDDGPEGPEEYLEPYTPEQARNWLEKHYSYRVDLIESLFGKMSEAGSGESKFTLRMPEGSVANFCVVRLDGACAREGTGHVGFQGAPLRG